MTVSVNFSPMQLDEYIASTVSKYLSESKLESKFLTIEVTENALLGASKKNINILDDLKKLGVQLAIDDFGTGYSSFSYLRKFSMDYIKIDKSFVDEIIINPNTEAIVSAMIFMGHELKMVVIAEGVEDQAQCDMLQKLNCDQYQGYLSSQPMPPEQVLRFVKDFHAKNKH